MTVSNELLRFCSLLARCTRLTQQMFEFLKLCRGCESQASSTSRGRTTSYFNDMLHSVHDFTVSLPKLEGLQLPSNSLVRYLSKLEFDQ